MLVSGFLREIDPSPCFRRSPIMSRTGPWQFSLRTLFLLTACVAVALSVLFGLPNVLAVPTIFCLVISLPALLGIVIVHGSSYQRAFCFGALFPAGLMLYSFGWFLGYLLIGEAGVTSRDISGWIELADSLAPRFRVSVGLTWILSILNGALCVVVRWLLESRQTNENEQAQTDAAI